MVILILGARPDMDLEVCRSFRGHLAKVKNLKVYGKFDREWTFLYRGRISILKVEIGL